MLACLTDGRALPASDLAYVAGVSPQTASGHLAKLTDAGLLSCEKQGRHRYFRIASPLVGRMLEGIMVVAQDGPARHHNPWRGGEQLRTARSCYDHMAGRISVAVADSLISRSYLLLDEDGGMVTELGQSFLDRLGVGLPPVTRRRVFCRPCLDWSERRPHIAGTLGAALLDHFLQQGWLQRVPDSRALVVTATGRRALEQQFGVAADVGVA